MRGFLYPVPALLLQEKQTTLSGAVTASAKKSGRSEDLPERATRPIRVRGALYLRMLPFALCCSRRFNSGYCQSRGSPFAIFSICISPCVQPVLPDWTTISNYKPRYSANSPGGYFGISMLWMYVYENYSCTRLFMPVGIKSAPFAVKPVSPAVYRVAAKGRVAATRAA